MFFLVDSCSLFISLTDLLAPDQSEGSSSAQQGSSGAGLTNSTQPNTSSIPPCEDSNQPLDLSTAPAAAPSASSEDQTAGQSTVPQQNAAAPKAKGKLKPPRPEIQATKSTLYTLNPLGIGVKYLKPKYRMPPGLSGSANR